MRNLLFLLLISLCLNVEAETLYVCPSTVNTATSAGSNPTTDCFDGTADVSWGAGAGSVSAGDTLCVVGNFIGTSEIDTGSGASAIMLRVDTSGTDASNRVTVDGDCDGDGIYATLDGDDAVGIGVRTAIVGTSQTTWTHVTRLNLTRFINKSIVTYNAISDYSLDAHQIWDYLNITDNGDGGSGDNCFDSRGRYIELSHSNISGCDEDGVYHQGKYFLSDYLVVGDVSRANTNGDGLQLAQEADGYVVRHMECDHTAVDSKQCFIVSVLSDTGENGLLEDAYMLCKSGAVDQNCAFITGVNAVARRIYTRGGQYGIAIENSTDSNGTRLESAIAIGATLTGINVAGTNPTGIVITNSIAAFNGDRGISFMPTNAATITDSVVYNNTGCGISRGHTSQVERYNSSYGNTTAFCVAGVSETAGTGSITTHPKFIAATATADPEGFKPLVNSPLRRAGLDLNLGNIQDYGNRAFMHPPSIGAWEVASGDAAAERTTRN